MSLPGPGHVYSALRRSLGSLYSDGRGQIGISALVLFIALLLIATTTAGVFFHLTGFLEARSGQVNDDVSRQMTNRISVISATGIDTRAGNAAADEIRLVVKRDANSGQIDLSEAIVRISHPNNTATLTYAGSVPPEQDSTFGVEPLQDPQNTAPVLTRSGDRFAIVVETAPLSRNVTVTLQITLQSGTKQTFRFAIPPAIEDERTVRLR